MRSKWLKRFVWWFSVSLLIFVIGLLLPREQVSPGWDVSVISSAAFYSMFVIFPLILLLTTKSRSARVVSVIMLLIALLPFFFVLTFLSFSQPDTFWEIISTIYTIPFAAFIFSLV